MKNVNDFEYRKSFDRSRRIEISKVSVSKSKCQLHRQMTFTTEK